MKNEIIEYIEKEVMSEKKLPCLGIVVKKRGKTLLEEYFGHSDYDRKVPFTGNEYVYLYSMSKPVLVSSAMRLVEQGKISLSTCVKDIIPEYKDAYLIKDGKKVKPNTDMTVEHLFTMSAGLDYDLSTQQIEKVKSEKGDSATTSDFVKAFIKNPLESEPGSKFIYSLCHDVLGYVIEVVSGKKLSDYVRENLFEPLGMENTTYRLTDRVKSNFTAHYVFNKDGVPVALGDGDPNAHTFVNPYRLSENYDSGGAGIISNARDYSKFADTIANGGISANGYKLLKKESVEALFDVERGKKSLSLGFECAQGKDYGYGLGVRTRITKSEFTPVGEFGWDGAAGSYVAMDVKSGLSITLTTHVHNWPEFFVDAHAKIRELCFKLYA